METYQLHYVKLYFWEIQSDQGLACLLTEWADTVELMDDDNGLVFYIPFNIIQVISRQWKDDNERLSAMKRCLCNEALSLCNEAL